MYYDEENFLMLSGIQHYTFCKRQWALIHIEQQWADNYLTVDGNFMHANVHESTQFEKRNKVLISRGLAIHSYELGLSGICDVVEFHECENGIPLKNREGKYEIVPIEYKRGRPKENDADKMQLVAQAMCLEEMFCCTIAKGYLFYGETKRRMEVGIDDEQRQLVRKIVEEMHRLYERGTNPKAKPNKMCRACSLVEKCLPRSAKKKVKDYIDERIGE
ncbi:MAG: CRISPR-associated protein Cas4 [Lachnospiraceae bacterium]|nr:CRISPR-associated protein Cas4 [Lachnospiraceae bacterium]